ncbi:hypothetical protein PM082_019087 [Marasmius tenuissimus]|nr:hypothetical protein PM082_019087 [Marasmius tenuissimus]
MDMQAHNSLVGPSDLVKIGASVLLPSFTFHVLCQALNGSLVADGHTTRTIEDVHLSSPAWEWILLSWFSYLPLRLCLDISGRDEISVKFQATIEVGYWALRRLSILRPGNGCPGAHSNPNICHG